MALTFVIFPFLPMRLASVSTVTFLRLSAWALPLPSAMASAKFANSTVIQSQIAIMIGNAKAPPAKMPYRDTNVTSVAPTSTTNITGLRSWTLGSSRTKDCFTENRSIFLSKRDLLRAVRRAIFKF